MTIEVKAYLKRFVGYVKVLLEPQPVDPNERAAHAESMGQAFNTVYSLLVEMCGPDETSVRSCTSGSGSIPKHLVEYVGSKIHTGKAIKAPRFSQRNWTFQIVTQRRKQYFHRPFQKIGW